MEKPMLQGLGRIIQGPMQSLWERDLTRKEIKTQGAVLPTETGNTVESPGFNHLNMGERMDMRVNLGPSRTDSLPLYVIKDD